jgi:PKD repeat protein
VEYVSQALYNPGQENTPLDITYIRPDYYLVAAGSTLLNLGAVADNCALALQPIAWSIDFGNNGSVEFSGNGQLSTYGSDIQFPLGTSRISYTVTDAAGNVSVKFVDLVVTPRPVISNIF